MLSSTKNVIKKLLFKSVKESELLNKVASYTFLTPGKLINLKHLAELINSQGIEGDFVECGVYKGGSAAMLATALPEDRHLWLYDSFQGMPPVDQIDGEDAKEWVGKCVATEEDVMEVMATVGISKNQYTIRKGWFAETFQGQLPEKVALLHCDADWYKSVYLVLETFYPLISEGGCVILDDFGVWEGCREAFYDFCCQFGEKPLLERYGIDQAHWIKGKSHNRNHTESAKGRLYRLWSRLIIDR